MTSFLISLGIVIWIICIIVGMFQNTKKEETTNEQVVEKVSEVFLDPIDTSSNLVLFIFLKYVPLVKGERPENLYTVNYIL